MSGSSITFKKDEVLVLLGAGASVDAGIPHSAEMVRQIEAALEKEWKDFKELYNYVRSAIFYADGIRGDCRKFWGARATRYFGARLLTRGSAWPGF